MAAKQDYLNIVEYVRQLRKKGYTDAEIRVKIGQYLELKARDNSVPLRGNFELTPFCNLDCKMCYIHYDRIKTDQRHLLSSSTWKNIMKQAFDSGMRKATLSGGECLTYPDFCGIYTFLYHLGVQVNLNTNGVLLNSELINLFSKYPPSTIQVTVYGSDDDAYERVTGCRVFKIVQENLNYLRKANLHVQLAITPSVFMLDDMYDLVRFVDSVGFPYEINSGLILPRNSNKGESVDLTIEQYVELYRFRASLKNISLVPTDPSELPDISNNGIKAYGLRCGAGRSLFTVRYDGNMMPCSSLDEYSVSILELGFAESWKRINSFAIHYPIPCECNDCVYSAVCNHCQAQHLSAPRGHCNPHICERTRKLAEAGFFKIEDEAK